MQLSEAALRQVLLAQSIERLDQERQLVSQPAIDQATAAACTQARQRGCRRVQLADVLLPRSQAIVNQAAPQDPAVAALLAPDARWRWVQRGLPLLALLLGLLSDRIGNAHRVDLLSPALLLLLLWNVLVYGALLVQAGRAAQPGASPAALAAPAVWFGAWLQRLLSSSGRSQRSSWAARLRADFYPRWLAHSRALWAARLEQLLHGCAAAWALGLALSLLLRGLVVRYQIGWESTFLQADQVHGLVALLMWPLTLLGAAPLSLADIVATENFAAPGVAGSRWVWLYVGLLLLYVVLPRSLLLLWSHWRQQRLAAQCDYRPPADDWQPLRQQLPNYWRLGVLGPPAQVQTLQRLVQAHQQQCERLPTPGDVLELSTDPQAPVDALLQWPAQSAESIPAAWAQAPLLRLDWADFAASWTLEPALLQRLQALLPAEHAPGLARLGSAWQQHNRARFDLAIHQLAVHLRSSQPLQNLQRQLLTLHGLAADWAQNPEGAAAAHPGAAGDSGDELLRSAPLAVGAGAGALAGAKVGSMIDLGLGGLTLGAGTALGALLGSTSAWAARNWQDKEAAHKQRLERVLDAGLLYLHMAHVQRLTAAQLRDAAAQWRAQLEAALQAQRAAWLHALAAPTSAPVTAAQSSAAAVAAAAAASAPLAQLLHQLLLPVLPVLPALADRPPAAVFPSAAPAADSSAAS